VRFVLLKWGISLLIEYAISQPIMVWAEMHLLHKYDVFFPRGLDDYAAAAAPAADPEEQVFGEDDEDDYDDIGLRRYLTSERTPLKRDLPGSPPTSF
jgi:hypothetical protein